METNVLQGNLSDRKEIRELAKVKIRLIIWLSRCPLHWLLVWRKKLHNKNGISIDIGDMLNSSWTPASIDLTTITESPTLCQNIHNSRLIHRVFVSVDLYLSKFYFHWTLIACICIAFTVGNIVLLFEFVLLSSWPRPVNLSLSLFSWLQHAKSLPRETSFEARLNTALWNICKTNPLIPFSLFRFLTTISFANYLENLRKMLRLEISNFAPKSSQWTFWRTFRGNELDYFVEYLSSTGQE